LVISSPAQLASQFNIGRRIADHKFTAAGFYDVVHAIGVGCKRFQRDVKRNRYGITNAVIFAMAQLCTTAIIAWRNRSAGVLAGGFGRRPACVAVAI
jgi:hypothetical protein